jgi:hypothetical protein
MTLWHRLLHPCSACVHKKSYFLRCLNTADIRITHLPALLQQFVILAKFTAVHADRPSGRFQLKRACEMARAGTLVLRLCTFAPKQVSIGSECNAVTEQRVWHHMSPITERERKAGIMKGELIKAVFWDATPYRLLEETCQSLGPTC